MDTEKTPRTQRNTREIVGSAVRFTVLLLIALQTYLAAQRQMITDSLYSPSLGSMRTFGMLVPEAFEPGRTYPVLWLLHGHDGSHRDWYDRTDVEQYVDGTSLIVVLPDADNSWYVDSHTLPEKRYEQYLMKDLFDLIEARFPIDPKKRAIAGLSMGGYGALLYAMKYPRRFSFAGSFSGAFIYPRSIGDTIGHPVSRGLSESLMRAFGPERSRTRLANDVYTPFNVLPADSLPFIYLATGIQDGYRLLLPGHRSFTDSLRSAGVKYEYHETPGSHSWTYWDRELKWMLLKFQEVLKY